jgi:hypothetical protein
MGPVLVGPAASDQDLRHGQAARKRGEVLDGVPDLVDQLQHAGPGDALGRLDMGRLLAEPVLEGLGVDDRDVEGGRDGRRGGVAARTDGPDELGTSVLVDDDHAQPGADRHDGLRLVGIAVAPDGTDQGGRRQVDAIDGQAGPLDRFDDAVDQVDVGGRHEHAAHLGALVVGVVRQDLGRQDRLVGREGDDLLRLEAHRALDLVVGHVGEVDLPGDGPQSGDPDDHR